MTKRMTINLPTGAERDLAWLVEDTGENQTELLAEGIRLLRLYRESVKEGRTMMRSGKDGGPPEIIFIL